MPLSIISRQGLLRHPYTDCSIVHVSLNCHSLISFLSAPSPGWGPRGQGPSKNRQGPSKNSQTVPSGLPDKNFLFVCCLSVTNDLEWFWSWLLLFEISNSHTSGQIAWIGKCMWLVISTALSKMKDLSRSQPAMCCVHVVISRKRCKIEPLLLQTTNRKWYMAYQDSSNSDDIDNITRLLRAYSTVIFIQLCSNW